ncbi:hypothetical protein PV10_01195 [Exophiala mesophila]|uniref:MHD domain-containing protein n=2 Tax=Exophiala mesophila TaxID=212818 RepID=A0A0D1ZSC7_EXOME|nr:uncharacterized protein PV10_01195 [Exophiala mesophila]KIV97442.1 hypothetical protein PV10_01195 [Exophiala mesophila]
MGDALRTEYPSLLTSLQPEQAITVLQDRVSLINKVNHDIADWLLERRKVEEAYVAGLRKLAKRPQQDGASALGVFQMPWQRIVSGTENLAASHESLAAKIETDVESPLRSFGTRNREFQALNSTQGNLASIAKDLINAQKKAAKGKTSSAEAASQQWESQAPYVFEQLQALDETRVNHLRDILTQFQTHELDAVEKTRASAESILNALLNVETADEIKTFAARTATQRGGITRRRSSATPSQRPTPGSSALRPPPTPPPPRHTDDGRSQRSNSTAGQDRLGSLPDTTPQKEKSRLGGLKRLGTVMGRRKSTVPPIPHSSNEEKRKTRSFAPFRRGDSNRSFHDLEETGQNLTPSSTQDYRPPSPSRNSRHEGFSHDRSEEAALPFTNGTSSSHPPTALSEEPASLQPSLQPTPATDVHTSSTQDEYPPATPAKDHTAQAHQDASLAILSGDDSGRNFQIRDKPIKEDESEAQLALSSMANQLRSQAQSSGLTRVQGSVRGRRDVRNTMFVPNDAPDPTQVTARSGPPVAIPSAVASAETMLASPIQRPPTAVPLIHDDHALASDTTSVHSARSQGPSHNHPELHDPGLNVSILETVHSWFTESGISKSFVVGEIALAYTPTGSADPEKETIRLQHFEQLDKVAVNPIYLAQTKLDGGASAEEQAGIYTVSLSPIRRPTPLVGLKYQLHLEESNLAQYSPVLLTPAWQIVEGQVSVILLYSLNPVFGNEPLNLKNVVISVSLDPSGEGKATSAMMAPSQGASFKRKASSIVWKFNDLAVKPEQERLLVRFMTQGGLAKKGSVEVKFEVPGRTASAIGVEKLASVDKEKETSDPFADDSGEGSSARGSADVKRWDILPAKLKLASGRYTAS